MTKAELYELLSQYLECEETTFETNREMFVKLAEEDIYRSVQLTDLRKNSTSTFFEDSPYLTPPEDFLSAYSMAVIVDGQHRLLLQKEVDWIREVYPDASAGGVPRFYGQFDDDTFIIGPTPDDSYPVELHYYFKPESITELADDGTTWLSENAENALLFGSIVQGYIFLKGDQDVIASYRAQFDKAIAQLQVIYEGRARKDSYRNIDKRQPV